MEILLIVLLAVAFIGLLGVNIFFRLKVFKAYKQLVRGGVEFDSLDIFSSEKVEQVIAQNPQYEVPIRTFTRGIRVSVTIASLLIVLITFLGGILMWFR